MGKSGRRRLCRAVTHHACRTALFLDTRHREPGIAVIPLRRGLYSPATFRVGVHFSWQISIKVCVMKQIFPVILALIPLAAVLGACVTCP
jgi:hypothetical protein